MLDAVRAALPADAAIQLDRQINAVERISRIINDEDVQFGPRGPGLERFDPSIAFTNRSLEYKLATLVLQGRAGSGKATVHAVQGHVVSIEFRPAPNQLGPRDEIVVRKTTLRADPSQPSSGGEAERRLEELAPEVQYELTGAWARRPSWAASLVEPDGVYEITLTDGAYLVLAQLVDTSFVVAGIDPARPGIRRYEPDGELIGEYASLQEALSASR